MPSPSAFQQVSRECQCFLAVEPNLSELLADPMTVALMAADHVEKQELDLLIAAARDQCEHHAG
jgi:hypothetical protein